MKLCDECLQQCMDELLPNDIAILYCLEGYTNFNNGLTRKDIYTLIEDAHIKATQANEILRKLEFVGLIKTNNNRKNIIYCLTKDGEKVLNGLLKNN